MSNYRYYLPNDFFGFSIEEMKKIILPVKGVILTDKVWKYDMLKKFTIQDIDRWHLKADTKKALKAGTDAIKQAVLKRDHPELSKPSFSFKKVNR